MESERHAATETVSITLTDDGILRIVPVDRRPQNARDAEENLAIARRIVGERQVALLVDLRESGPLEREARLVYATQVDFAVAQALLVDSIFSTVAANLYLRLTHTRFPMKIFRDEAAATEWLKGFVRAR